MDDNDNHIVWERGTARISVNSIKGADYAVLWIRDRDQEHWTKKGYISLSIKKVKIDDITKKYLSVSEISIDPKYRGDGYGTELYRAVMRYANSEVSGIISYLPNRSNKKQVPAIYSKLGAYSDASGDYCIIPITRM